MKLKEYRAARKSEKEKRKIKMREEYAELKKTKSQYDAFDILSAKYGLKLDSVRYVLFNNVKKGNKENG